MRARTPCCDGGKDDLDGWIAPYFRMFGFGFTPTQLDGKVHRLAVKVKQPGLAARARRSYLAAPDKFSVSEK